jgi:hypothetical protein
MFWREMIHRASISDLFKPLLIFAAAELLKFYEYTLYIPEPAVAT